MHSRSKVCPTEQKKQSRTDQEPKAMAHVQLSRPVGAKMVMFLLALHSGYSLPWEKKDYFLFNVRYLKMITIHKGTLPKENNVNTTKRALIPYNNHKGVLDYFPRKEKKLVILQILTA